MDEVELSNKGAVPVVSDGAADETQAAESTGNEELPEELQVEVSRSRRPWSSWSSAGGLGGGEGLGSGSPRCWPPVSSPHTRSPRPCPLSQPPAPPRLQLSLPAPPSLTPAPQEVDMDDERMDPLEWTVRKVLPIPKK
jgi:hypothetical protein